MKLRTFIASLFAFLAFLSPKQNLAKLEPKYSIKTKNYKGVYVVDRERKTEGWLIKDKNNYIIGDDGRETNLYSNLAAYFEIASEKQDLLSLINSELEQIEKIKTTKTYLVDFPEKVIEYGSELEGLITGAVLTKGKNLTNLAQREIIKQAAKEEIVNIITDYAKILTKKLSAKKHSQEEISSIMFSSLEEIAGYRLEKARYNLLTARKILKNLTPKNARIAYNYFTKGFAEERFSLYLMNYIIENKSNLSSMFMNISKHFLSGFSGLSIDKLTDFAIDVFLRKELIEVLNKAEGEYRKTLVAMQVLEDKWNLGRSNSMANKILSQIREEKKQTSIAKKKPVKPQITKITSPTYKVQNKVSKKKEPSKQKQINKNTKNILEIAKEYCQPYKFNSPNLSQYCSSLDVNNLEHLCCRLEQHWKNNSHSLITKGNILAIECRDSYCCGASGRVCFGGWVYEYKDGIFKFLLGGEQFEDWIEQNESRCIIEPKKGISNSKKILESLYTSEICFYGDNGRYASFEELKQNRRLVDDWILNLLETGCYKLDFDVEKEKFLIKIETNLDNDPEKEIWTIDDYKRLNRLQADVPYQEKPKCEQGFPCEDYNLDLVSGLYVLCMPQAFYPKIRLVCSEGKWFLFYPETSNTSTYGWISTLERALEKADELCASQTQSSVAYGYEIIMDTGKPHIFKSKFDFQFVLLNLRNRSGELYFYEKYK